MKKLIYVCAPFSGEVLKNINNAIKYAEHVFNSNEIPVTPHLLFPFLDERVHREVALEMDMKILKACDELWVFGDVVTSGMKKEIELASKEEIRIRFKELV